MRSSLLSELIDRLMNCLTHILAIKNISQHISNSQIVKVLSLVVIFLRRYEIYDIKLPETKEKVTLITS
jgi:hypothetical protein